MVSNLFRHCVWFVRVDKSAPWSAHDAIAFDVIRKLSKIQSWQLVSPSPLTPVARSQCSEEWLNRCRVAQSALPSNSPQEASVAHLLLGPALRDSLTLSQLFSTWSVASERYLKSECEVEGPASKFPPEARSPWESRRQGNAEVRRRALEAVMGTKKAAHAYLKGLAVCCPSQVEARGPSCFSPRCTACGEVATPIRSVIGSRPEAAAHCSSDLQKFYDSICVSHFLRLRAECGFPVRVAVVDPQVHLGLRAGAFAKPKWWPTAYSRAASFPNAYARNICCTAFWRRFAGRFTWSEPTNTWTTWLSAWRVTKRVRDPLFRRQDRNSISQGEGPATWVSTRGEAPYELLA